MMNIDFKEKRPLSHVKYKFCHKADEHAFDDATPNGTND